MSATIGPSCWIRSTRKNHRAYKHKTCRSHLALNAYGLTPSQILARIAYMTTLPVADARAQLSRLVDEAERTHERFEITRNGRRAAVLLGADDYDALRETIAVLADESLLADHITGTAEVHGDDVLDADSLAEFLAAPKTDDE